MYSQVRKYVSFDNKLPKQQINNNEDTLNKIYSFTVVLLIINIDIVVFFLSHNETFDGRWSSSPMDISRTRGYITSKVSCARDCTFSPYP